MWSASGSVTNGKLVLDIAAIDLSHSAGLWLHDLVPGLGVVALGHVAVAVRIESLRYITRRFKFRMECPFHGADVPFEEGLAIEHREAVRLASTLDYREGTRAFVEKRPPHFS